MGAIPAMAMAKLLNPRLTSTSHSPFSLSPTSCFPQCFPISSSSGTFQLKGGARLMRFASNVVTVMGESVVENSLKLCASQHVGSGSVERNDAAPTGPLVKPEAKLTAKEAVEAQMNALVDNDDPRPDHGLEVMYQFANSEGMNGSTMTHYFGFASDLYHFGHFALKFKSRYPELICHGGYEITSVLEDEDRCEVKLKLLQGRDKVDVQFLFSLSKRSRGVLPPCWLTDSLLKLSEEV